jgi:hypothetical protein
MATKLTVLIAHAIEKEYEVSTLSGRQMTTISFLELWEYFR